MIYQVIRGVQKAHSQTLKNTKTCLKLPKNTSNLCFHYFFYVYVTEVEVKCLLFIDILHRVTDDVYRSCTTNEKNMQQKLYD